jgi:hypothetical protein
MEQLPKIALRRLQENQKPGVHPDPDLLAAFTEKSLNDRERVQVLQHLAVCADCRDVVSLAMPQIESTGTQTAEPPRWLTWPVLRWGALAACVIVVSAAVTLRYERRQAGESSVAEKAPASLTAENNLPQQPPEKLATKIPAPAPFQPDRDLALEGKLAKQKNNAETGATLAGVPAPPQPEQKKQADDHLANALAITSADKSASSGAVIVAVAPHAPSTPNPAQTRLRSEARNNTVEPLPSTMAETVTVQSAAPVLQTSESREQKTKDESTRNEPQKEAQAAAAGVSGTAMGDQRSDTLSSTMSQVVVGGYAKRSRSNNVPRWTLSPDGVLQRSWDSGKTWQTIPVANNIVFRALAANGSDIWLGGAAGALYHSSDAGQHWVQVNPVVDGQPLTADIVTVEFSDPLHGKLTTSNHEIWSTSDAGNTWQRH